MNNLKEMGITWEQELDIDAVKDSGFRVVKNFLGVERPFYNNVLYGSSTFCKKYLTGWM